MWDAPARRPPGRSSGLAHRQEGWQMRAERAAIVTGASSGIGLAIAKVLGRGGLRADGRRAGARRSSRAPSQGLQDDGYEVQSRRGERRRRGGDPEGRGRPPRALRPPGRARQQRRASASARRSGSIQTKHARHAAEHQPALDRPLLPGVHADASRGRRRAQERDRRQHRLDLRQARRGLAVGLLGDQAWRRRLDGGDEQGDSAARASSRPRSAPPSSTRR